MPFRPLALLALLAATAALPAAFAQPATATLVPAAENAFTDGLAAYEAGRFEDAYRLFNQSATGYAFHTRTTAALLMAAKAAYAAGELERAETAAATLVQTYPGSRYAPEAERVRALAREAEGRIAVPFELGVVLPAAGEAAYIGQALFNGIRIAVDEHNATRPRRPVRMIYRDSRATAEGARSALAAAADAGARAAIGPLFSDGAIAAATVAEARQVVLLAPLATEEAVTEGRRYVFQANPTFPMRGRAMARYAAGTLGLRDVGVVAQTGTMGTAMADAFAAEAQRLGARVVFNQRLANAREWGQLERVVGAQRLGSATAVYLPVTGNEAPELAAEALRSLESLPRPPRPLGNTEWEDLSGSRQRASRLGALFTSDFFVVPGATDAFGRRYSQLSGLGPDRIALMGYDLARFLISQIDGPVESPLADRLRSAPRFEGLAHRFAFAGGQVNEAVFVLGFRGDRAILVE
ncbi:MAG: ABC transporter substrate-binding protein [Rubricoccaceae bacterium]